MIGIANRFRAWKGYWQFKAGIETTGPHYHMGGCLGVTFSMHVVCQWNVAGYLKSWK